MSRIWNLGGNEPATQNLDQAFSPSLFGADLRPAALPQAGMARAVGPRAVILNVAGRVAATFLCHNRRGSL
jgi:hypothetical protein